MKEAWETPRIVVQDFEANEYIAACWKVGCLNDTTQLLDISNAPYGYRWGVAEGPKDPLFSHNGPCRVPRNTYFKADGSSITFEFENDGTVDGGFDFWGDVNLNGVVDAGDVIYWHTSNQERTWCHWGVALPTDKANANRS